MSQEQEAAVRLTVNRTFEWLSRFLQVLLVALILWFGNEVVELRTLVAVLTERIERFVAIEQRIDRLERHIESVDGRVRSLESSRRYGPTGAP